MLIRLFITRLNPVTSIFILLYCMDTRKLMYSTDNGVHYTLASISTRTRSTNLRKRNSISIRLKIKFTISTFQTR